MHLSHSHQPISKWLCLRAVAKRARRRRSLSRGPTIRSVLSFQARNMSDYEDLGRLGGQANASESHQLNPASVIVSVVFSLIFLLGTVGNSLVLAVLLRSGQVGYNTTNLFILNLSLADFSFIVFCVPFQATIYSLEDWVFGSFMCKVVHFFINLTMYASSFTLAAVSVDRYRPPRPPPATTNGCN